MKTKKMPKPLGVAAILLCLVLISAVFASGLRARFRSQASAKDAARAAAFSPAAEGGTEAVTITATGQAEYVITVRNLGETAVRYNAVVDFSGEDPDKDAEKFDEGTEEAPKLTFTGELGPGEEAEEKVTLDMVGYFDTLDDKWDTVSNDDISGEAGDVPFAVLVTFTQID